MHTSPCNKYYVGITDQEPEKYWRNGKVYENNIYFADAIKKYGWCNFRHEIMTDDITEEEAKKCRNFIIEKLQSNNFMYGYNVATDEDTVVDT